MSLLVAHHYHHQPTSVAAASMSRKRRLENVEADVPINEIAVQFASTLVTSSPIDVRQVGKRARNPSDILLSGASTSPQFEPLPTPGWPQPRSTRPSVNLEHVAAAAAASPRVLLPEARPDAIYTYDQVCQIVREERRLAALRTTAALEQQRQACADEYAAEFAARVEEMYAWTAERDRHLEQCQRQQRPSDDSYFS
jgi:hypothetical protein